MKICVVQAKAVKGGIEKNIQGHIGMINSVVAAVNIIIFPELSLTGYEPALAAALAMEVNDTRLDVFQEISDIANIIIGAGAPVKTSAGVCIGMIIFQPGKARQLYSKKFLHADEIPFFISGEGGADILAGETRISFAICYELSVPEHAANAADKGAAVYIASVAKSAAGIAKANKRLAEIAEKYSMIVCMANSTGYCDNFESAGQSAIWNNQGLLLVKLNDSDEGLLLLDTVTQEVISLYTKPY